MIAVIAYDITDDARREDVAMLLSGFGPRVQLSVFECELRSADELRTLRAEIRARIDPLLDPGGRQSPGEWTLSCGDTRSR